MIVCSLVHITRLLALKAIALDFSEKLKKKYLVVLFTNYDTQDKTCEAHMYQQCSVNQGLGFIQTTELRKSFVFRDVLLGHLYQK